MDLSISEMMALQKELYALHKGEWTPMEPEYGHEFLLYLMEELGEVCGIWKKKGSNAIMAEPSVRQAFLEEMADVLMYYNEVLLRYQVTADEISTAYRQKHDKNMRRDYTAEYKEKFTDG